MSFRNDNALFSISRNENLEEGNGEITLRKLLFKLKKHDFMKADDFLRKIGYPCFLLTQNLKFWFSI